MMPESSLRANKYSSTKWEEPDTVFGGPSDKKPYSKDVGHVRFDRTATKAISDGTTEEAGEEKKERRKKKKSKERDAEATVDATAASVTAAAAADHSTSEADPVSAVSEGDAGAGEDEEKERKKLEKKKRKQEREAAAKAAMEAELAALAAAEAELARLEAESSKTDAAPAEAAPAEAAPAEVKRTDESEEPATTQAEEARLGAQDDTEAPADATATTTDAADATPDADAAVDAADAATAAEAGTDDTADAADAAPSTRIGKYKLFKTESNVSIVVDSVDGEVTGGAADEEVFGEDAGLAGGGDIDARSDVSNASSRGSRTSLSKEETDAKLALFKTEAAARLTELERLLDEHDQIIRELKRSESDSGCINYVGVTPAPCSSANNLDILPITVTPPATSRTAPTSPLCSQPRSAQHQGGWKMERENSN